MPRLPVRCNLTSRVCMHAPVGSLSSWFAGLTASATAIPPCAGLNLTVTLSNTGSRDGDEVSQVRTCIPRHDATHMLVRSIIGMGGGVFLMRKFRVAR